jgi:pimeloyl-ACP methyl ester carboxylesterase
VRTRRAYFECRFGQLHVRTAFPTTGGFDEGVTLFCVHPSDRSGRIFRRFLPEIADDRPVYAPDLPGHGESDPAYPRALDTADAAGALLDLARDLKLRQIDVLGFRCGSAAAVELAAQTPALVRRLVLIAVPPADRLPLVNQETLVLRIRVGVGDNSQWAAGNWPRAKFVDLPERDIDMIDAAPKTLAEQVRAFLKA